MRATNVLNVSRTGDFGGEKIAMGIDPNSMAHIMSVLTDLYSNRTRAVIREYSTNARDSHIDAGVSRPIEVTLPNGMSPFFKVRDFGLGLDIDDLTEIYSQYGASTKRNSDLVNGMLGLGCKSALTYTSQFTIVSVKDGQKITVVVSRSEDGSAGMEVVDQVPTTDSNGVEITVPVKHGDAGTFAQEATFFYQFWEKGTVLVNGQVPTPINLDFVTDNIGLQDKVSDDDLIVMGNVAYPVKDGLFEGRPYGSFRVVAYVNIGEVAFTPSRESLMYTSLTNSTVDRLRNELKAKMQQKAIDAVNAAPTHRDAFMESEKWKSRLGASAPKAFSYNGEVIPAKIELGTYTTYRSNYGRGSVSVMDSPYYAKVDLSNLLNNFVVRDYDGVKISPRHKEKINKYRNDNGITGTFGSVTYLVGPIGSARLSPWVKSVSWEDIKAIKFDRPPVVKRDPALPVYDSNGYEDKTIPLDRTKTLLYVSPTARLGARTVQMLYAAFPNIQIFLLGENRWEKFKRENPKSDHLRTWISKQVTDARDHLTPDDLVAEYLIGNYGTGRYKHVDTNAIDDPHLRSAMEVLAGNYKSTTLDKFRSVRRAASAFGIHVPDVTAKTMPFEDYPLLSDPGSDTMKQKHIILYANAAYEAKKNGAI